MLYLVFLAVISGVAGFFGGLTGTGGIIMPPLMIGIYGVDPRVAMAMAQASYILPSALSVILFFRKGHFVLRLAAPLTLAGFGFSWWAAAYLKPALQSGVLSLLFALCVILSGAVMLWRSASVVANPLRPPKREAFLAGTGAVVGVLAGITGSGSNSVLVPLLTFLGFNILNVLAAGQCFSVLVSVAGTVGNMRNMDLNFAHIGIMVATQLVGMNFGTRMAQRTDTARLKRIVGFVCLAAGLFLAVRVAQDLW